ncbi:MAG: hypothetical protein JW902_16615 [Syntrophaceae bacterium]|nr:hypothetical protein [Syntrophaceae bacterium]
MISKGVKDNIVKYVMERHCLMGGFCFYRIEEPNGSDTYYALSILKMLDIPFYDERTVAYLRSMQQEDGSYDSVFAAFYSLKSLLIMNQAPGHDPWPYIYNHILVNHVYADKLPAEITSIFRKMTCLVDLYINFRTICDRTLNKILTQAILPYQNRDFGFGYRKSTLGETADALVMLKALAYPVKKLDTIQFISRCEIPIYGFTDIPGAMLAYLEYVYAGLLASKSIHYEPRYKNHCAEFVANCQNINGGFSRTTHNGIATLENTFYAVHAMKLLSII